METAATVNIRTERRCDFHIARLPLPDRWGECPTGGMETAATVNRPAERRCDFHIARLPLPDRCVKWPTGGMETAATVNIRADPPNPRYPRSIRRAARSIIVDCLAAPPRLYWTLCGHE